MTSISWRVSFRWISMYNTLSPVFVAHRLTHSLLLKKGGFILSVPLYSFSRNGV